MGSTPRPIPAPPEGFQPFVNGEHVGFAGYASHAQDKHLLAYVRGGWHPVEFVHRTNRRSVEVSYRTGDSPRDKGRQRVSPERVAAPAETLHLTWDELRSGDVLVQADVVDDLLGPITAAGRGYNGQGAPFVDVSVIARDGAKEIVRRRPDTPVTVRRIVEPSR